MDQILSGFEINSPTWFYLAFLLALAVYFKFTRLWSLRNLDLVALLALAPGWLFLEHARVAPSTPESAIYTSAGYIWLFVGTGWWLLRMLLDPLLVRRPTLEPNMAPSGLTFLGAALLAFLMAEVVTQPASDSGMEGTRRAEALLKRPGPEEPPAPTMQQTAASPERWTFGPGWPLLHTLGIVPARALVNRPTWPDSSETSQQREVTVQEVAARTTAILAHVAILLGLVLVAYLHFGQLVTGIVVATLYLLLPYTAYHVGRTDQVLPGALLVWTLVACRYPVVSGMILGLAAGTFYFPLFLLPLWTSFYWNRGAARFLMSVGGMLVALFAAGVLTTAITAHMQGPGTQLKVLIDPYRWQLADMGEGFWQDHSLVNVIPVFVAFVLMCVTLALGRQPKNLVMLMAHSAAVILGAQFWYMPEGGTYVLWYLPLVLLVVFRPNLK